MGHRSSKHQAFHLLSFLFACTESSTQDERLTVDLSSCLDSLDGWSQFLECAQRPNQGIVRPSQGFCMGVATERGWQSLTLVNGDWTSDPNGSQRTMVGLTKVEMPPFTLVSRPCRAPTFCLGRSVTILTVASCHSAMVA